MKKATVGKRASIAALLLAGALTLVSCKETLDSMPENDDMPRTSFLISVEPTLSAADSGLIPVDIFVNDVLIEGIGFHSDATLFLDPEADGNEAWIDFYVPSGTRLKIADFQYTTGSEDALAQVRIDIHAPKIATPLPDLSQADAGVPMPRGLLTRYEYRKGWTSMGRLSVEEAAARF